MRGLRDKKTGSTPGRIQVWIRLVVVLATLAVGAARGANFSVALDHDSILLGDTATLSLTFEDAQPQGTPQLPELPGLQIVSSGQSTQFGFSGGRSTSSVTYSYGVKATEVGEFSIPSFTIKLGKETLSSQPVSFKVVRPAAPEPGSEAEQQALALLRIIPPKKEVYVGETVVLEMQLLVRGGVQRLVGTDLPGLQSPLQLSGCTVGNAVSRKERQTVIGSTTFTLVPILIPVTVLKPGPLTIGPLDGSLVVELPSRTTRQPDLFDPFGMFNRGVQQRVAVSAAQQTLTALPLPDNGKPAAFSGAVGQFEMAVSAGPTNVAVGDPVTIRVQINGRGSMDAFTLPDQPAWKEFKVYPPTVKTETSGDLGLDGTKTFEQVVVPQNTEIKELPPFEFSYFDPEKRRYQTLHQGALALLVRPSGSAVAPTITSNGDNSVASPSAQDIVHIKPRLGALIAVSKPWVTQPWFLAMQGVPVLGLIGAAFWRRRCDTLANNPRLRRQRQVEQVIRDGFTQLRQLAAERNSDAFFAVVFRLLQEQIGERLNMPASAITEAAVDDTLPVHGLGAEGASLLHELFQQCNQARYAPVQSLQELEAVIPKLEAALAQVKEVRG
jgi:hypothetical protein